MASSLIGALRINLGLDSAELQEGLRKARENMQGMAKNMQKLGRDLSLRVTAPVVGFGALSLRAAGNFEAAMNRVEAVSGASTGQLAELEAQAKRLGATTQFSASEAAGAIEMLAKNGVGAADILGGALDASLTLAAASGTDLATSSDIATDVMLQFGKEAGSLGAVIDGISGVLVSSKFDIDDYRLALAQAGGVAGGLGVEFEDFNAAIAGTSSLFASGSDAGTSFKTFLQRLVPASAPAAQKIKELGLEFFDASGNMKSMREISQELKEGLAGLSEEARNDALSTIFGTDAMRTAIGLAGQGADGIDRLKASIDAASATDQASARMQGLNGTIKELTSAFEALQIAIGQSGLLEFATQLVERLTGLVQSLSQVNPEFLKWGTIVAGAAAAIGPMLVGLGFMMTALAPLAGSLAVVTGAVRALSLALVANPIGATVAAIAIGGTLIYQNWSSVGPWLAAQVQTLQGTFAGLSEFVKGVFAGDLITSLDGIKQAWGGIASWYQGVWDATVAVWTMAWEKGIKPITDALGVTEPITAAWQSFSTGIQAVLQAIAAKFEWLMQKVQPVMDALKWVTEKGQAAFDGITGLNGRANQLGQDISAGVSDGIGAGLSWAKQAGARLFGAAEEGVREAGDIHSPSRVMRTIGAFLSDGLALGISDGASGAKAAMAGVTDGLANSFDGFSDMAQSTFKSVIDGSKSVGDALRDMASSWLSSTSGSLFSAGWSGLMAGFGIGANANGTNNWRGGLSTVNERGDEIMNLPKGTQIIPHDVSMRMAESAGRGASSSYAPVYNIDARGAQAGVGEQIAQALAQYDQHMPDRIAQIDSTNGRRF